MGRRAFLVPALATLLAVTGCGQQTIGMPGGGDDGQAAFQRRATDVARAWREHPPAQQWRTGFVPLQDLTLPPAHGFPDVATKEAFAAGLFRLRATLPDTPASGSVRFPDGSLLRVPVVGARTAYELMDRGGAACAGPTTPPPADATPAGTPSPSNGTPGPSWQPPDAPVSTSPGPCSALTVTAARFGTAPLRTSRGVATVPVWLFTVAGLAEPVARVAVSPDAVDEVPQPPALPPVPGNPPLAATQHLTGVKGLTLRFVVGVSPCVTDVRGRVLEGEDLVVVGATFRAEDAGQACPAMLKLQPVTVTLEEPLGQRLVVDAVTAQAVPLSTSTP